jgi:hypothetical protein
MDVEKKLFAIRFAKYYPKKRLLAVHLNGFTHSVFYDNGKAIDNIEIDRYSHYMPENEWSIAATNMFYNIHHHKFQNNPIEIIYIEENKR